jgi:hypothetical protein
MSIGERRGAGAMPIYRLIKEAVFDPEHITAMTTAFEDALRNLGLVDRSDPLVESVAKKIVDAAKMGERDPERLRVQVLRDLNQSDRQAC